MEPSPLRSPRSPRIVALVSVAILLATDVAATPLPARGPLPADRYAGLLSVDMAAAPTDYALQRIALDAAPVAPISGSLRSALSALDGGDAARARAIAQGMSQGSLERDVLHWAIALSSKSDAASIDRAMRALEIGGGVRFGRSTHERRSPRTRRGTGVA